MIYSQFLFLLLWQAIQIALLVTVTRIVLRVTGKNRPLLAHALWVVVLIKCLTPPMWSSSIGVFSQLAEQFAIHRFESNRGDVSNTSEIPQSAPLLSPVPRSTATSSLTASMSVDPLANVRLQSASHTVAPVETENPPWYAWWLIAFWVGGAILCGSRRAGRVLQYMYRLRSMPVRSSPEIQRLTRQLANQLRLRRHVRIDVVEGDIGPVLLGWFRPRVLVPAILVDKASHRSLRSLIAHELVHLRRGDLWWAGLQEITTCLWWFHPSVRQAGKCLEYESEKSCDEETIAALKCEPAEYARCLLDVLEYKHQLRAAPTFPGVRAIDITMERMERIMNMDVRHTRRMRYLIWPLMVIACAVILPGAQVGSAQNQSDENAETADALPNESLSALPAETTQPPVIPNPVLDQAQTTQPKLTDEVWTVRTYNVGPLLKRLQQSGLDTKQAEMRLFEMLPAVELDKLGHDLHVHTMEGNVELPQKRSLKDGKLMMLAPNHIHQEVANLIQHGNRFGFEQVMIEAALLLVPTDLWGDLDIEWKPTLKQSRTQPPSNVPMDRATPDTQALPKLSTLAPQTVRGAGATFRLPSANPTQMSTPIPTPVLQVSARTTTRQVGALEITTIDDRSARQIVESIDGAQVLSMPKVITMNGRSATIEIGKKEQIVIGYQTKEDGKSFEPMREEVTVGTRLNLSPEVVEKRLVKLGVGLRLTRVNDPPQSETPAENNRAIQSLRENYIETICNIPLGDTLAIGGMYVEEDGGNFRLLCLLSCQLVERISTEGTEETDPNPTSSETKAVPDQARTDKPVLSFVAGSDGINFSAGTHGTSPQIFDLLGKAGQKVEVTGDIHAEQELSRLTLTVENLQIDYEDGDRILSKQAWIRMTPGASAAASLRDDVHILLGNRKIRADEAEIIGETVILNGNVHVSSDAMEFKTSKLRLSVDSMETGEAKSAKSLQFRTKRTP